MAGSPRGLAGHIGDTSAEGLGGAGEDLGNTMTVLEADIIGMTMVAEAACLNNGEEAPADLGFFLPGKFDRDEAGGVGTVEQRP
jgi:hypothetical protein